MHSLPLVRMTFLRDIARQEFLPAQYVTSTKERTHKLLTHEFHTKANGDVFPPVGQDDIFTRYCTSRISSRSVCQLDEGEDSQVAHT
jgi:hypothetical protein